MDIDGCLIDSSARFARWNPSNPDSSDYWSGWQNDRVIAAGYYTYLGLIKSGVRPVFLTARPERVCNITHAQIMNALPNLRAREYDLIMRPENLGSHSKVPDQAFKMRAVLDYQDAHLDRQIVVAFDDNTAVVAAYRALGIVAYQTTEGWS